MQWDIFCRVVDNFGDVGFGWRLAADLAARGEAVRFWLDDQRALTWMAPVGAPGVTIGHWADAGGAMASTDVVVETFGCGVPSLFAVAMAERARPPVWINVEHLSAETVVERNHGLPSPRRAGPGSELTLWYFYPGYTEHTGGLLREPDLAERQRRFSRTDWLRSVVGDAGSAHIEARIVSLYCYENAALPELIGTLSREPTLLLVAAESAVRHVESELGPTLARGALKAIQLPHLSQHDYDHLLWSCDINFVRGEDSLVRAQWAGVPWVWQIYPQHDQVHVEKLHDLLDRHLNAAPPELAHDIRQLSSAWNGVGRWPRLPRLEDWELHAAAWRAELTAQRDLSARLLSFAASKC